MVEDIPSSLQIFMFVGTLFFMGSAWFIFHLAARSLRVSLTLLVGILSWYGIVVLLGSMNFFSQDYLIAPNIIFVFIFLFFFIRYLYSLKVLQEIVDNIPIHQIVIVQFFRVLGYGFLVFYSLGLLPGAFAIPTGVGDMFVGITAVFVAYFLYLKKSYAYTLAKIWNFVGIADLLLAISLGILTYQWFIQLASTDIPSNPIAEIPLITVPVFAVPLSLLLHLFTLRKLRNIKVDNDV